MKKIPITKNGLINLHKQLDNLKNIERPKIISEIKIAREFGDLKENAEYHAAKNEQFLIEKKIKEIESKLINIQVIDITKIENKNKIIFGSTVELTNISRNQIESYQIVGEDETDIKNNKISINSPLAKSLILKSLNEVVNTETPNGVLIYKINKIQYI